MDICALMPATKTHITCYPEKLTAKKLKSNTKDQAAAMEECTNNWKTYLTQHINNAILVKQ
jgi:hypothetical protein